MRKLFLTVAAFAVVSAVVIAQHTNSHEVPVKSTLTVAKDVNFGPVQVPAGEYRVICDRERIKLTDRDSGKVALEVKCEGKELPAAATDTLLYTATAPGGGSVVTKLLIKGSNIEHVF
jgi:hypothetical protein